MLADRSVEHREVNLVLYQRVSRSTVVFGACPPSLDWKTVGSEHHDFEWSDGYDRVG
jgi:hypothetical protein